MAGLTWEKLSVGARPPVPPHLIGFMELEAGWTNMGKERAGV